MSWYDHESLGTGQNFSIIKPTPYFRRQVYCQKKGVLPHGKANVYAEDGGTMDAHQIVTRHIRALCAGLWRRPALCTDLDCA
ncbi:hypothetical protein V2G26_008655 [Clonostachys chloroleuca]